MPDIPELCDIITKSLGMPVFTEQLLLLGEQIVKSGLMEEGGRKTIDALLSAQLS